ncbi:MAG TPA: hemolysin family protein [Xanthobacteraceae bacterium]|nr:hemolysin family protein [Xanthobacteraceae bacterium]
MLYIELTIVVVLIAVNGVLAMSELAVVSSRPARLKTMIDQDVTGSRQALALSSDPGRFLSTVQIGITLVGILAGAFSGATLSARFTLWLQDYGLSARVADPVALGLVVTAITYLSLVAGELVPKQLALRRPEKIACRIAPVMVWLAKIGLPFVWVLDRSSRLLLRVFGGGEVSDNKVTDEEIRSIVAEAESAGVLEPEERAMIAGVMRLGDRPVSVVMTPRHDIDFINLDDPPEDIRRRMTSSIHSRMPVCEGSLDQVVGIIQAKDLLGAYLNNETADVRSFVRQAPVIPETMDALDVIELFKSSSVHMGLVYDEYGHLEGLVTAADILEAIVGEFRTDAEEDDPYLVERDDGSYLISGAMPADELAEKIGVTLPADRDYHTVAGLLLAAFGRIPEVAESIDTYGWRFEVMDLDGRRIDKVLAQRVPGAVRRAAR